MRKQIMAFLDKDVGTGASDNDIALVENVLHVKFPHSYREFLLEFGWARFSHQELYGVGTNVPIHLDLIRNAVAERETMEPPLPGYLVPIMNDGAGNSYCLDCSSMSNDECPVVFWDHEERADQKPEVIAPNFHAWLKTLLKRLTNK